MEDFFTKEQTYQIYRLCQQGYADEVTVARLANLGEEKGLERYLDEARRRRDIDMFREGMKRHKKQIEATCKQWVQECLQSDDAKSEALKLKPIVEALGWTSLFRQAWIDEIKSQ